LRFHADNTGTLEVWELSRSTFDHFKWSHSSERSELTFVTEGPPQSDFFPATPFKVSLRKETLSNGGTREIMSLSIWMNALMSGDQCVFPAGTGTIELWKRIWDNL
jgi:hypothetical protein